MALQTLCSWACQPVTHAPRCALRSCGGSSAAGSTPPRHQRCSSLMHPAWSAASRQLGHRHCRSRRTAAPPPCSYGGEPSSSGAAGGITAEATGSLLIQKEVVLFLIQQDYDKQLQRALNNDNFEAAAELRQRRERLVEAVDGFQASKGPGDGCRDARQTVVADIASEGLRLRSEMQRAAEEERYADASALRDRLSALQKEADTAAVVAAEQRGDGERQFRLGQRVLHSRHGFRGIVCGWDVRCCEDGEWQAENGIDSLAGGPCQTFYHVLVDLRDWEGGNPQTAISYVAEELLSPPETAETWGPEHGDDATFMHPYAGILFLGNDHAGDFLPSKALREKYSTKRRDVGPPEDGDEGADDDDPASGGSSPGGGFGGGPSSSDSGPTGLDIDGPGGGLTIV